MKQDKAGKAYWDEVWNGEKIPLPINPDLTTLDNQVNIRFHEFFSKIFPRFKSENSTILEVGCAQSSWLPYFTQQFGLKIYGLDYSELGCEQSREVLKNANIQGEIVCGDLFSPPASMLGKFDFVVTFGVVEHFSDTQACIKALAKFLKPGGILITNIPNMAGLTGVIQKAFNRPVYDIHVPLDRELLANAHQDSSLNLLQCDYFLFTNFGVPNLNGLPPTFGRKIKGLILKALYFVSKGIWWYEQKFSQIKPNRFTSPYILCAAQKQSQ